MSSPEKKEVMKEALDKAQAASGRARDKLDFATQVDVDQLKGAVDSIRARVSDLEESVFGSSKDAGAEAEASEDAQVDRILAKIAETGMDSLTTKERRLLQRVTDRQRTTRP